MLPRTVSGCQRTGDSLLFFLVAAKALYGVFRQGWLARCVPRPLLAECWDVVAVLLYIEPDNVHMDGGFDTVSRVMQRNQKHTLYPASCSDGMISMSFLNAMLCVLGRSVNT